jgi:hypothetical protein
MNNSILQAPTENLDCSDLERIIKKDFTGFDSSFQKYLELIKDSVYESKTHNSGFKICVDDIKQEYSLVLSFDCKKQLSSIYDTLNDKYIAQLTYQQTYQ